MISIILIFIISVTTIEALNATQHPKQIPISAPTSTNNNNNNHPSTFNPLLPPAIPLAVRSPYLSAWLATGAEGGNGGYLTGRWPQFWPIQFPNNPYAYRLGWSGLIRIKGITYQFLGNPNESINPTDQFKTATQLSFNYTSTRSIFEFQAGEVRFLVDFLSPPGPAGDLLRQSLPFTYLSIQLTSSPSNSGPIEVYTDFQADWASGDHQANVTWSLNQSKSLSSFHVSRLNPLVFSEQHEYAEWGEAIYSTASTSDLTTASGYGPTLRTQFSKTGKLDSTQDKDFRKIEDRTPAFGFATKFQSTNTPLVFTIGHVRDPYVSYILDPKPRSAYWTSVFKETNDLLEFVYNDFGAASQESTQLDQKIHDDAIRTSGENYAAIATLSFRQGVGAIEITVGKNNQTGEVDQKDVKIFSKEISSNGDMSTVDVIFPQFPILTYYDPVLLKYLLEPLLEYSESGLYPNKWTVHDLGRYPNATAHNDGNDEAMPVEEAGNFLIMSLAYHQLTKDTDWLKKHHKILTQWTSFLITDGLIPASQLSTDDFAGKLANQTDLALKAIIGIGAMSEISLKIGDEDEGNRLRKIAEDYIGKWIDFSVTKDRSHTKLAYQDENSWGTLYNLFADRLLNLRLVPQTIYEMQSSFYPLVANEYGVPLDYRHTWAKTDWEMFAAAAATSAKDRDLFVNCLTKYLKANLVNAGFPDLYETQTAQFPGRSNTSTWRIEFINRPVVGGHFSLLALDKAKEINGMKDHEFFPQKSNHWS